MRFILVMVILMAGLLPVEAQFNLDARTKSILDIYYLKKGSNSVTSANIANGTITTNDLDAFIVSALMSMTNGIQWSDTVIATNTVVTNLGQSVQFDTTGAGSCATSMIGRAYWNAGSLRYCSSVTFDPGYGEVPRFLIEQGDPDWIFTDVENAAYYTNFNLQAEYMPMNDEVGSVLVSGFVADSWTTNTVVITNTVLEALIHAMLSITNIPAGSQGEKGDNGTNGVDRIETGYWQLGLDGFIRLKTNWFSVLDDYWTTNSLGYIIVRP